MKMLVACEFSGVVRQAFAARGWDAWSCDLLPSEDGSVHHIVGDVVPVLGGGWDLMVAHPPCTHLSVSGARWWPAKQADGRQAAALDFVRQLLDAPVPRIALENPVSVISTVIRRPDQIVQPWMFGHDAAKATCLWLKGLPLLLPTKSVQRPAWIRCEHCDDWWCNRHLLHTSECACPDIDEWAEVGDDPYRFRYANQTPSGQNKLGPSPERSRERSRTYAGIATAMADQWTAAFLASSVEPAPHGGTSSLTSATGGGSVPPL